MSVVLAEEAIEDTTPQVIEPSDGGLYDNLGAPFTRGLEQHFEVPGCDYTHVRSPGDRSMCLKAKRQVVCLHSA